MVFFNYALRKLNAKIVYYGPGLCGKTTNLQWIHDHFEGGQRGKMISLSTEGDRTIFFDLLPLEIGTIRGMEVTLQLYTVPGQVHYNSTRQLVLRGADGVVFVADSQRTMQSSDVESLQNLQENLMLQGIDLKDFPHVIQFNKRDLRDLISIEEMDSQLNQHSAPFFEAVATEGVGVQETLEGIVKLVMRSLRERYEPVVAPGPRPMATPSSPVQPAPAAAGPTAVVPPPVDVRPAAATQAPATPVQPPVVSPVQPIPNAVPAVNPVAQSSEQVPAVSPVTPSSEQVPPVGPAAPTFDEVAPAVNPVVAPPDQAIPQSSPSSGPFDLGPSGNSVTSDLFEDPGPDGFADGLDDSPTDISSIPSVMPPTFNDEPTAVTETDDEPEPDLAQPPVPPGAEGAEVFSNPFSDEETDVGQDEGENEPAPVEMGASLPDEDPFAVTNSTTIPPQPGESPFEPIVPEDLTAAGFEAESYEEDEEGDFEAPPNVTRTRSPSSAIPVDDLMAAVLGNENEAVSDAASVADESVVEPATDRPVVIGEGDPFAQTADGLPSPPSAGAGSYTLAPSQAEHARPVEVRAEDNQLNLRLQGTGAIVESGQVRALDIEVPVPGSWVGHRRVTLQLRLTLSPAPEEEDGGAGGPA